MDKILLIDDEPDIVRVLGISLKADGYEVIPALSGAEGLEAFTKDKPEIVITDIKMPGMDGIEVLEKIKAIEPNTEVIIVTGHGDIDNTIEALKYGASDFINKPVRDEALSIALDRAKEKLDIKRKLKEYTIDLEKKNRFCHQRIKKTNQFSNKAHPELKRRHCSDRPEFENRNFQPRGREHLWTPSIRSDLQDVCSGLISTRTRFQIS